MIRVFIVILVVVLSWKIWDYTAIGPAPASPNHQQQQQQDFKVKETVRDQDEDDEGCCKDDEEKENGGKVVLHAPQAVTQHKELVVSRIYTGLVS